MTIREAQPSDLDRLVELGCNFIDGSVYRSFMAINRDQLRVLASQLMQGPRSTILVSEHAEDLTGMLGLIVHDHFVSGLPTGGEVFWWVEPQFRGHGLALLKAAERWAQDHGAIAMQMIAPDARVGSLYTRLGYEPVETTYQRSLA